MNIVTLSEKPFIKSDSDIEMQFLLPVSTTNKLELSFVEKLGKATSYLT